MVKMPQSDKREQQCYCGKELQLNTELGIKIACELVKNMSSAYR
ncbi:hypothetical protein [Anaplasma phagocytophilum]